MQDDRASDRPTELDSNAQRTSTLAKDDSANLRECFSDRFEIQKGVSERERAENIYKTDGRADDAICHFC